MSMNKEKNNFSRLLKFAINAGVEKAVRVHIKLMSSLNSHDENGMTPLMLAAKKGHVGMCRLFLDKGADPKITDKAGRNACDYAEDSGNHAIVQLFQELTQHAVEIECFTDTQPVEACINTTAHVEVNRIELTTDPVTDAKGFESVVVSHEPAVVSVGSFNAENHYISVVNGYSCQGNKVEFSKFANENADNSSVFDAASARDHAPEASEILDQGRKTTESTAPAGSDDFYVAGDEQSGRELNNSSPEICAKDSEHWLNSEELADEEALQATSRNNDDEDFGWEIVESEAEIEPSELSEEKTVADILHDDVVQSALEADAPAEILSACSFVESVCEDDSKAMEGWRVCDESTGLNNHVSETSEETPVSEVTNEQITTETVVEAVFGGAFDEVLESEDLGAWVVEEELSLPEEDDRYKIEAAKVQTSITAHTPIDTSEDWSDIFIELPELIDDVRLFRSEKVHGRLAQLFNSAYVRGYLSEQRLHNTVRELFEEQIWKEVHTNHARRPSTLGKANQIDAFQSQFVEKLEQKISIITGVLEDFGTVIMAEDIAYDYQTDIQFSADSEQVVDDALLLLEQTLFNRDDPLKFYFADIPRTELLTREQEAEIGKRREAGVIHILSALAGFPMIVDSLAESCSQALSDDDPVVSVRKIVAGLLQPPLSQVRVEQRVTGPLFYEDTTEDDVDLIDDEEDDYDYQSVVIWIEKFQRIVSCGEDSLSNGSLREHLETVKLTDDVLNSLVAEAEQIGTLVTRLERQLVDLCVRRLRIQRSVVIHLVKDSDEKMLVAAIKEQYSGNPDVFEMYEVELRSLVRRLGAITSESRLPIVAITRQVSEVRKGVAISRKARNDMVTANLKLALSIVNRYQNKGMEYVDMVQEANIGLIKAAEKFDYRKGFKFSTYATWWIRQAITRALADQSRHIRIPVHMVESINKYTKTERALEAQLGRRPTITELAEDLEFDEHRIQWFQTILAMEPDDTELDFGDIASSSSYESEFCFDQSDLNQQIDRLLQSLTVRDSKVLKMRFGIGMNTDHTLEEVGKQFDVTRERIRQIESKALKKLQHTTRSGHLRIYTDGQERTVS